MEIFNSIQRSSPSNSPNNKIGRGSCWLSISAATAEIPYIHEKHATGMYYAQTGRQQEADEVWRSLNSMAEHKLRTLVSGLPLTLRVYHSFGMYRESMEPSLLVHATGNELIL